MIDFKELVSLVQESARIASSMIVPSMFSIEGVSVPIVSIDGSTMPDLIRHVSPKLVYLQSVVFDAQETIEQRFDGDDEGPGSRQNARKLASKWHAHDGQLCQLLVGFVYDGVVHLAIVDAEWLEEFEGEAESLVEEARQLRIADVERALAIDRKRLAAFVADLRADPRFTAPRIGAAKRRLLAGALFPGEDDETIARIVEIAEGEHFLSTVR